MSPGILSLAWSDLFWLSAVAAFVAARFVWPTLRERRIRALDGRANEDPAVRQRARVELMNQIEADMNEGRLRPEVVLRLAELETLDGLALDAALRLEALEWAVADRPELWQLTLLHLANAYLASERPDRAADAAYRASQLQGESRDLALSYLCVAQVEQGLYPAATELLSRLAEASLPAAMRARLQLAEARIICNAGGDHGRAERLMREAMREQRPLLERLTRERSADAAGALATRLLAEQGPYR
jgi:hypothetical protein